MNPNSEHQTIKQRTKQLLAVVPFLTGVVLILGFFYNFFQNQPSSLLLITLAALLVLILIYSGYYYSWGWTGFGQYTREKDDKLEYQRGKTLWDWLQLLIVPVVLSVIVTQFNAQSAATEHKRAEDQQQEDALQKYIDIMSGILLDKENPIDSSRSIQNVARTRTLSILHRLDGERKGTVIQFLQEAQLISTTTHIIRLDGASLEEANLSKRDLSGADLQGVNMHKANLSGVDLHGANLKQVDLSEATIDNANFNDADLRGVDLRGLDLQKVTFVRANLQRAHLEGAHLGTLSQADLRLAFLKDADLAGAFLGGADLRGADLKGADLTDADLTDAKITPEQLSNVKSLHHTTMPDKSKHE